MFSFRTTLYSSIKVRFYFVWNFNVRGLSLLVDNCLFLVFKKKKKTIHYIYICISLTLFCPKTETPGIGIGIKTEIAGLVHPY